VCHASASQSGLRALACVGIGDQATCLFEPQASLHVDPQWPYATKLPRRGRRPARRGMAHALAQGDPAEQAKHRSKQTHAPSSATPHNRPSAGLSNAAKADSDVPTSRPNHRCSQTRKPLQAIMVGLADFRPKYTTVSHGTGNSTGDRKWLKLKEFLC
jgi:hypothetical protein